MIKVELIIEPFSQILDVFIGTDVEKINQYINDTYELTQMLTIDNSVTDGTFYYVETKEGIYRFICLSEFSQRNIGNLQNFIHELYHAVRHVLKQVQVKTRDPHDELTAYLMDSLLGKFLTKMKNKTYKKI